MRYASILFGVACAALASSVVVRATILVEMPHDREQVIEGDDMPRSLSEFAFFKDAQAREPARGVVPYELNTPLYSDGAIKHRYLYLPANAQAKADGDGLLQLPVGSAIIKTFAFMDGGNERYVETRVLLHRADGWLALPYRWNDAQTEARLAIAGGRVPVTTPGGQEISYRIPNKNQCKTCHSKNNEVIPIGPKARNLSPEFLADLVERGMLDRTPAVQHRMPRWTDVKAVTAARARAYLDANCAHCHQPGGGASNSGLDLRWEQADPSAFGVRKHPVAAGRGAGGLLVGIQPGEPDKSILVYRMNSTETGVAMPELGRSTIDQEGVDVVSQWIEEMAS